MNRFVAMVTLGGIVASTSVVRAVTVESFDTDFFPDSVYGSWTTATLTSNPTNFEVSSKQFGGGYLNIIPNVDGTGMNTVQLQATVSAGVAGFIVALGDTTGHEWNYAWYGNTPGGGTNGTNDYLLTKPVSAFNFSTGAAGPLDVANIDYIHIQVDPGFNPNTVYDVTYNDLSLVSGAANLSWNNTGGTGDGATWDVGTNQNWNNGAGPAVFNQGDTVTFNTTNNGHSAVTINSAVNPGSTAVTGGTYTFNGTGGIGGSGGLTVSGATLTVNNVNTYSGATTVNSGATLNVNGTIPATALNANGTVNFGANASTGILARPITAISLTNGGKIAVAAPSASGNRTVLVTNSLSFAGTSPAFQGALDLGANDLVIHGGDASIRLQLQVGLSGLAGIMSSAAAASGADKTALGYSTITAAGSFDGQAVASGDVVVKYTLVGDSNLDATVNFSDLLSLAQNYGAGGSTWSTGDFNYDGVTNFSDLLGLAQNYAKTLSASEQSQLGASFSADYALALSQVPEPGVLSIFGLGALKLLTRRRR